MNRIFCASLLVILTWASAPAANAAGTYQLDTVIAYNPFVPAGVAACKPGCSAATAGTAVVNGPGNVSATGIQFSFNQVQFSFNLTGGTWSAIVGGTSLTHTESCADTVFFNNNCDNLLSGLTGVWNNTQASSGNPTNPSCMENFLPAGSCDRLVIVEVAGVSLTVYEQSESMFTGLPTGYNYFFYPDTDGDGVLDPHDNCKLVANPSQLDANADGYGNLCDGDLNNSGTVTTADFGLLRSVLGQAAGSSATAAASDMNGSGTVTTADFGLLRAQLGTVPGPSGLACAGTIPCP